MRTNRVTVDTASDSSDLRDRPQHSIDWRAQYERHTVLFLSAALLGGIVLAGIVGSGRSRRAITQAGRRQRSRTEAPRVDPQESSTLADFWSDLKGALGGALSVQAYSLLGKFIPGIEERAAERTRRRDERPLHSSRLRPANRSRGNGHAAGANGGRADRDSAA